VVWRPTGRFFPACCFLYQGNDEANASTCHPKDLRDYFSGVLTGLRVPLSDANDYGDDNEQDQ
jgi:hypothetical protein